MPIYEFECEACQTITEVTQSISAPPLGECPACAGPVKKLISQSSFQLKGGGWYADGYSTTTNNAGTKAPAKPSCAKSPGGTCPCAKPVTA